METVVVRQTHDLLTEFSYADSRVEGDGEPQVVAGLHDLTPYGMLLAALGSCTAILLHSYAQSHQVDLEEVTVRATYARVFDADCEQCEGQEKYTQHITAEVGFRGKLSPTERNKLFLISKHCPVHKILRGGVATEFQMMPEAQPI